MQGLMYNRRDVLRLGAAAAASLAIASCGSSSSSGQGDNTLTVSAWGVATDTQSIKDAIAQFQKENPTIKVTVRAGDCGVSFPACKTLIAGRTMPDLFVPGIWNYNAMVNSGVLENLEASMDRDKVSTSDFNPKVISEMKALKDGKIYGLPMGYNVQSLYYNKEMFDKAKLAYPPADGNYTWDDLRGWAKKLTLDANGNNAEAPDFNPKAIKQWGFFTLAGMGIAPGFEPILLAFGGSAMTLPDRQHGNLENPNSIKAWQFIQDLMWKDHSTITPQVNQEEAGYLRWGAGKVAMQQGSHEQTTIVNQSNPSLPYDMAPLPKGPAGHASVVQMHIWSIYAGSKKKDLAWKLLKYLTTTGSGTQMGLVPAYKDYAEGPDFLKAPKEPAHLKEAQLDPTTWPLTTVPSTYNQSSDLIGGQDGFGPVITDIINNKKTAADAVRGIDAKIDALMKR